MNVTLPILLEEVRRPDLAAPRYRATPLLEAGPAGEGEQLSRALSQLTNELRKKLDSFGREMRHDILLRWTFCPTISEQTLKERISFRRGSVHVHVLVVAFDALERRIAMMPALPGRWFEIQRGQNVLERAREVLIDHLDELQKEQEDFKPPEALTTARRQWISTLEVDVQLEPDFDQEKENFFARLGTAEKMSGRNELHKVGRCLESLYPDELDRAVLRDAEVAELEKLLAEKNGRPILLLGPPRVGKTAIIHECVHRRVKAAGRGVHVGRKNIWLLSPQRLISGMSYLGQWEARVLAIVDEAIQRNHVLYFDDVLGLYYAGLSADSDLTAAHVLKPHIERREFRMLAEMTPEVFRVLQERDRGMADLFHILPIRPTTTAQTRQVMISVGRQLEGRHHCRFDLEVQPAVLEITERYQGQFAQPGKSAMFLRQLASKHAGQDIRRANVLNAFSHASGLILGLLDTTARIDRNAVVAWFKARITGQVEAINAMADVICMAKARMNDPGRPLATFLFLGPTGVGKTQCAKMLAKYLFNDESRILRFDMNEYVDGMAVTRLNGGFRDPEGLLTSSIRRQPFSVLLFDEIEKAHPAIFDLLLQVLGEGRLTDALGRTADFGNAIIILTSNLGVREAGASFGLRPAGRSDGDVYLSAAERFFRPEFINRLDRIIPFHRLTRKQIRAIADRLIVDVFQRDGLVHRRCVLLIEPAAMEKVAELGYHELLGARELKRCIERQLTQPLAARLAAAPPDAAAVIRLYCGRDGIAAHVQSLIYAPRGPILPPKLDLDDLEDLLDRVEDAVERIVAASEPGESHDGLVQGQISRAHYRYLAIREYGEYLRRLIQNIDRAITAPALDRSVSRIPPRSLRGPKRSLPTIGAQTRSRRGLRASQDLRSHLAEFQAKQKAPALTPADQVIELIFKSAVIEMMSRSQVGEDRCLVWLRTAAANCLPQMRRMVWGYTALFEREFGFTSTELARDPANDSEAAVLLEMPGIAAIMTAEQGTHLFTPGGKVIVPIQVIVAPLADQEPMHVLQALRDRHERWRASLADGSATPEDDPFPLGQVIRLYEGGGLTVDLRSGLVSGESLGSDEIRNFLLTQLPLPAELEE